MALWNVKNLPMPPINTFKAVDNNIDIKHLNNVFQEGCKFFDNDKYLNTEFAVMSRIIYRMKLKFRSAKDFKMLEKLHKALDNYFKTNISYILRNFTKLIPSEYTSATYLPNKNMLDYILVRLQGLVKLMERIVETCKITAYLYEKRLNTGHFWKLGAIIFSIVSRVYVLAKCNAKFICDFYKKILPFSNKLKNSGYVWLPKDYILPTDLQQWMNVEWLEVDDELQIIETPNLQKISQFFDLIDDDDDDIKFCNEYIMVPDDDDEKLAKARKRFDTVNKNLSINQLRGFDIDEDVGEVIEINDSLIETNFNLEKCNVDNLVANTDKVNMENGGAAEVTEQDLNISKTEDIYSHHEDDTVIMILDNSLKFDNDISTPSKTQASIDFVSLDRNKSITNNLLNSANKKSNKNIVRSKKKLKRLSHTKNMTIKSKATSKMSGSINTSNNDEDLCFQREAVITIIDSPTTSNTVLNKKKKNKQNNVNSGVRPLDGNISTNTPTIDLCSSKMENTINFNRKKSIKAVKQTNKQQSELKYIENVFHSKSNRKRKLKISDRFTHRQIKSDILQKSHQKRK